MTTSRFLEALGADGPSADRAGKMDLYGRFVGSWDLDVTQFREDGVRRQRKGEWHFGCGVSRSRSLCSSKVILLTEPVAGSP